LLAGHDLLYVADAYGVYRGDYTFHAVAGGGLDSTAASLERSSLIFGGVTVDEASAIAAFQRAGGAVVAEFNTLESPTADTPAADTLAAVVGARYAHWLGRWFRDLGDGEEIPQWLRSQYHRYARQPWTFHGPGLVVLADSSDRIVIVTSDHFSQEAPVTLDVDQPADSLAAGMAPRTAYWYWFCGVRPEPRASVVAWFTLHVDSVGAGALNASGFPTRFPAVVRRAGTPLGAYIAADLSDVGADLPRIPRTRFVDWIRGPYASLRSPPGSMRPAFWRASMPLWDGMVRVARLTPPR
jgi:hypothetical protein